MKHLVKNIGLMIVFLSLLAVNACKDNISPIYDELDFNRVFAPLNISAEIINQTTVKLSWELSVGADSYELEIIDVGENIINTATVAATDLPYVYDLPAGDAQFYARAKAISNTSGIEDSKWTTLAFRSLPENLFEGYNKIRMDALGAITLYWKPGKAVTALTFVSQTGETSFDISAAEATAGEKSITGLANDLYQVRLMNDVAVRGSQNYTMEGDVLLATGEDLAAAITAASPGSVIVLSPGEKYGIAGGMYITKSIKIKGMDEQPLLPIVYPISGNQLFIVDPTMSTSDSLVFENLHMNGLVDLVAGSTGIRGIFDQENAAMACNIAAIKFLGCTLTDWGRQIIRLRGGADQIINEVVIDDCIIRNLGKSSASYGIISAEAAETNIGYIKISNSTIDSIRSHLIRYPSGTSCNSLIIENCTVNRAPFSSGRFLMDLRDNVFIGAGVQINNCILGNTEYDELDPTASSVNGIRMDASDLLTITNTYVTDDYDDSAGYSIPTDMLIPAGTSSTGLWSDPANGDFTFKGAGIDAGDPRWK